MNMSKVAAEKRAAALLAELDVEYGAMREDARVTQVRMAENRRRHRVLLRALADR